jgi:hypothetical protein
VCERYCRQEAGGTSHILRSWVCVRRDEDMSEMHERTAWASAQGGDTVSVCELLDYLRKLGLYEIGVGGDVCAAVNSAADLIERMCEEFGIELENAEVYKPKSQFEIEFERRYKR